MEASVVDRVVENAKAILRGAMPQNSSLDIEVTDEILISKYIIRATYTSPRSGKSVTISQKMNVLPLEVGDQIYRQCVASVVLDGREQAALHNRIRFLERVARQEAFLIDARNILVSDSLYSKDRINYEEQRAIV